MKEQKWFCEVCGKLGMVPLEKGEGVFDVLIKIEDSHHGTSPECQNPISSIRVVNMTVITNEELGVIMAIPTV